MTDTEAKFERWMARVDDYLDSQLGMCHLDLADFPYWDEWQAGMTPAEAGRAVIQENS